MTVEDAAALARQIARVLQDADASFLLAIEYDLDDQRTRAVWHVGGNHTAMANMAAILLDGVVKGVQPSDCAMCNAAVARMERAGAVLGAGSGPVCH